MKIKVVHRDPCEYNSDLKGKYSLHRRYKNVDPRLHPFEKLREIHRSFTAAKMERMFSKPLVAVLDGHRDSVCSMSRCYGRLADLFTGSCDGEIRHWDVAQKRCLLSLRAHKGFVRGLTVSHDDYSLLSCGDDRLIKLWTLNSLKSDNTAYQDKTSQIEYQFVGTDEADQKLGTTISPNGQWTSSSPLTSIDHHRKNHIFVTTGDAVDIWNIKCSTPLQSINWNKNADAILCARFNPSEYDVLLTSARDNTIGIIDTRKGICLKRIGFQSQINSVAWNPMRPLNFVLASEDHNLYSFDMRYLDRTLMIHKDFTNAVLDVDFSPTGLEFLAGSYDRTLRIFPIESGRSREVYYGKRMQIVLSCRYSLDSRFIFSGSSDFCVRVWKNKAWEPLGPRTTREKRTYAYREALKARYKHVPEVKRVLRHRHVPKYLRKAAEQSRVTREAHSRKEMNIVLHSSNIQRAPEKARIIREVID